MAHLTQCIRASAPVHVIDEIVRTPALWPAFRPAMDTPRIVVGHGDPGTTVVCTVHALGRPVCETTHVQDERHGVDGSTHWRWGFEGPLTGRLILHHEPVEGGTMIRADLEYSVSGGALGEVADRWLVESRQRRDLYLMLDNLKTLSERRAGENHRMAA
jgi:hypothetical protein